MDVLKTTRRRRIHQHALSNFKISRCKPCFINRKGYSYTEYLMCLIGWQRSGTKFCTQTRHRLTCASVRERGKCEEIHRDPKQTTSSVKHDGIGMYGCQGNDSLDFIDDLTAKANSRVNSKVNSSI